MTLQATDLDTARIDALVEPRVEPLVEALSSGHQRKVMGALVLGLIVTIVLAIGIGPVAISPATVSRIVARHLFGDGIADGWPASQEAIVWQVRFPRVLLGVIVGAALAIAGVALQGVSRNVLADPYVLGVSSGASTGAAAAILFGVGSSLGGNSLAVMAFLGALAATAMLLGVARLGGAATPVRLLLAGVAVGYVLHATTSLLIFASDSPEGTRAVMFWLLGSLAHASWTELPIVGGLVGVSVIMLVWHGRRLDVLAIGDDTALSLGVAPGRARVQLLIVVALCVGGVVSVSGGIGFVGLVIPHIARRAVGQSHRRVLPVAAVIGAIFLVWSDVLARVVLQPRELPIGVITALVGAPFLVALVRRFPTSAR